MRKLDVIDPEDDAQFGYSVAISGDTIVVGALRERQRGGHQLRDGRRLRGGLRSLRATGAEPINGAMLDKLNAGGAAPRTMTALAARWPSATTPSSSGRPTEVAQSTDRGAAYVFERNQGGGDSWGQMKLLTVLGRAGL